MILYQRFLLNLFPAPSEVDREIYKGSWSVEKEVIPSEYPAPREVDREIYVTFSRY